jgi:O-antigen/teichoic acid export membrane protein
MASTIAVRQVLTMGSLAFTAAVVARYLGPRGFGQYSGGTAAFNLVNGLTDLGFSIVLMRELSADEAPEPGRLIGTTVAAQCLWGLLLSLILVTMAAFAHGVRADVMFILAPNLVLSGLAASRTIFGVRFIVGPLLVLDISTTVAQCVIAVVLAFVHAPVVLLAVNLSGWYCLSFILAVMLARRQVQINMAACTSAWNGLGACFALLHDRHDVARVACASGPACALRRRGARPDHNRHRTRICDGCRDPGAHAPG